MRKLAVLAGLLVAFGASAADKGGTSEKVVPSLEDMTRMMADDPRYKEAAESRTLFFQVPEHGAREVRFRVTIGDRPYLEESVTLPDGDAGRGAPAVELLAREPQRLARLYALAANKVLSVKVAVSVDGREVQAFSFDELVRYNQSIKFSGLRPVAGESKLTLQSVELPVAPPAAGASAPQPDGPCEDQCWWDYQSCLSGCTGGCAVPPCYPIPLQSGESQQRLPYPGDCSYCDSQYNYCLNSCPPPCQPGQVVSESTYTQTELVAIYGYYWDCLSPWWNPNPYSGEYYQWTEWVYKITTYRRRVFCEGTVEVTAINVQYGSSFCQYPTYIGCGYPWGTAYWTCF